MLLPFRRSDELLVFQDADGGFDVRVVRPIERRDRLSAKVIRQPAARLKGPSLASHNFELRSGLEVEEIAIRINDVLYYTLPCIAELVYPDPCKWKQFWETVCRSLMPHRENIIQDKHRVRSVSELTADRLPHGNPGAWTEAVIRDISREIDIAVDNLPEQLIGQLGVLEKCWPYIQKTARAYHRQKRFSGQPLWDHLLSECEHEAE